jgi:DNA-binding response OmpR family regulator
MKEAVMAKKILVVDDEKDMLFMLRFRLEAEGYAIITAEDGIEAYSKIIEEKPDLVLLDILLPGIDGLQLCRKLKDNQDTVRIPVIMLTASNVQEVGRKCSEAGADGYLKKPFDSLDLLSKVKFLLGENPGDK